MGIKEDFVSGIGWHTPDTKATWWHTELLLAFIIIIKYVLIVAVVFSWPETCVSAPVLVKNLLLGLLLFYGLQLLQQTRVTSRCQVFGLVLFFNRVAFWNTLLLNLCVSLIFLKILMILKALWKINESLSCLIIRYRRALPMVTDSWA